MYFAITAFSAVRHLYFQVESKKVSTHSSSQCPEATTVKAKAKILRVVCCNRGSMGMHENISLNEIVSKKFLSYASFYANHEQIWLTNLADPNQHNMFIVRWLCIDSYWITLQQIWTMLDDEWHNFLHIICHGCIVMNISLYSQQRRIYEDIYSLVAINNNVVTMRQCEMKMDKRMHFEHEQ